MASPEQDSHSSRRDFLRGCSQALVGVVIVGVVAPVVEGCEISMVRAGDFPSEFDVSSLTADGQSLISSTDGPQGSPLLITRLDATTFRVLSMNCPHEGCTVDPPSNTTITCQCHQSQFALNGALLRGPATRALTSYPSTFNATTGILKVTY